MSFDQQNAALANLDNSINDLRDALATIRTSVLPDEVFQAVIDALFIANGVTSTINRLRPFVHGDWDGEVASRGGLP